MCFYYYLHYHHIPPCMRDIEHAIHYNFCSDATYSTLAAHLSPTGEEQCTLLIFPFSQPGGPSFLRLPLNSCVSFLLHKYPETSVVVSVFWLSISFSPKNRPRQDTHNTGDVTFPLPIWYHRRKTGWGRFSRTAAWLKPPFFASRECCFFFLSSSEARLQQRCLTIAHTQSL